MYNVHEEPIVNDMARSVPRIYASMENWQADHQASMVELEGISTKQTISILITQDPTLVMFHLDLLSNVHYRKINM